VHNLCAHTYVGTVLINRLYFYNLNLYIISAMTLNVQELYTRWKRKVSKRFTSHHRKYSTFFLYSLYLSFLIAALVIMSRSHTILPICYIRICNENAFHLEFRFTKFSVIVEEKFR